MIDWSLLIVTAAFALAVVVLIVLPDRRPAPPPKDLGPFDGGDL